MTLATTLDFSNIAIMSTTIDNASNNHAGNQRWWQQLTVMAATNDHSNNQRPWRQPVIMATINDHGSNDHGSNDHDSHQRSWQQSMIMQSTIIPATLTVMPATNDHGNNQRPWQQPVIMPTINGNQRSCQQSVTINDHVGNENREWFDLHNHDQQYYDELKTTEGLDSSNVLSEYWDFN